jgi:hypothetical protein
LVRDFFRDFLSRSASIMPARNSSSRTCAYFVVVSIFCVVECPLDELQVAGPAQQLGREVVPVVVPPEILDTGFHFERRQCVFRPDLVIG